MKIARALVVSALSLWGALNAAEVDVGVTLSAPPGPVSVMSNLVYTAVVTNAGGGRATGVVLTDALPPNLAFVSAVSSRGSCTYADGIVSCTIGILNGNESAVVSIWTQPIVPDNDGVVNTVTVNANEMDNNPDNNIMGAVTRVGLVDLAATLSGPSGNVVAGDIVTYVLTVTNRGPDTMDVIGSLGIPSVGPDQDELISVQASAGIANTEGQFVYWQLPGFMAGESATLTLQVRIASVGGFAVSGAVSPLHPDNDWDWSNNRFSGSAYVASGPGILEFSRAMDGVLERQGMIRIAVERRGGSSGTVGANFRTLDGAAMAGSDYVSTNGTVTFTNGEIRKELTVRILPRGSVQCARAFSMQLFGPTGAFLRSRTNTVVTVFDDDVIPAGITECVTVTHSNAMVVAAGENFTMIDLSKDGRFALFRGNGPNLVTNDLPYETYDVFVRDLGLDITRLVTVNTNGTASANDHSAGADLSANGRYVAFQSAATDLVTNSVNGISEIFVRDLVANKTMLVSVSTNGATGGNGLSSEPIISSNGAVVAFYSVATDLVSSYPFEQIHNLFARDLVSNRTHLVTVSYDGIGPGDDAGFLRDMSADGRFILFYSGASNLVEGDTNGATDAFVRDIRTGRTLLVSANSANTGTGDAGCSANSLQITPDGRFVVFYSDSSDLVANDTNGKTDVFIRDLLLGTTRLVSVNTSGTGSGNGYSLDCAMTPDARYVALYSDATDLVSIPPSRPWNLFLRDMQNGVTTVISVNCDGRDVGGSGQPLLSDDGRFVSFLSSATDLVPGDFRHDANRSFGYGNIYRKDLLTGATVLVSANYGLTGGSNPDCGETRMSGDGKVVLFVSGDTDLSISRDDVNGTGVGKVYAWRELPPGANTDVRVTTDVKNLEAVMVATVALTNFGPDTADGIFVSNAIPAGAQFLLATTTQGTCTVNPDVVTCAVGSLERRAGVVITLIASATGTNLVNLSANAIGSQHDPLQLNNVENKTTTLALPPFNRLSISYGVPWTFVSWLQGVGDLHLESTALGGQQIEWSAVETGIFNNGILSTLILGNQSAGSQFYRLRRP